MENVNTEDDKQFWEATSVLYGETWSAIPKITDVETQTKSHLSNWLDKMRKHNCLLELCWSHFRQQGSNRAEADGLSQTGNHRSKEAGCQQITLCPQQVAEKHLLWHPIPEGSTIETLALVPSLALMQSQPTGICLSPAGPHHCLHTWHILLLGYPNSAVNYIFTQLCYLAPWVS